MNIMLGNEVSIFTCCVRHEIQITHVAILGEYSSTLTDSRAPPHSGFLLAQEEILVHYRDTGTVQSLLQYKNTSSQLVSNFNEANKKLIIV